ncbi:hypothetical protein C9427_11675 [Mesorhizobium helmanticense]|uniref:Lytic murein transglycosylase n=1 Tax=Mesorhizobium helmanticense TaxID=1776423 RepID=A0A2T4IXE9_9HYPH|nr:hypothetical protein C9427_11675 [Mesorhizobium helmanticense]
MALKAVVGNRSDEALYGAPLCPAGHLPHKEGDRMSRRLSPITKVEGRAAAPKLPISPLVGEMSGRTEGSAKDRGLSIIP